MKPMSRRIVEKALRSHGCEVLSNNGPHTKWGCPCGSHHAAVPRHNTISPAVVRDIQQKMACLPKEWLQ